MKKSLLAVVMSLILLGGRALPLLASEPLPEAKQGLLKLKDWSPSLPLALNGTWMVFPNEMIDPSTVFARYDQGTFQTTALGKSFADLLGAGHQNNQGFATYALILDQLPQSQDLAFTPPSLFTAGEVFWVNRDSSVPIQSLFKIGRPAPKAAESIPGTSRAEPALIKFVSGQAALVIHVSNFHHSWGGLWSPPSLGIADYLLKENQSILNSNYLATGVLLFIAFSNFSLFLRRREDKGSFWLGILAGTFAIRSFAYLGTFYSYLPIQWHFSVNTKIIYSTMCLLTMLGHLFFGVYFPKQFSRRFVRTVVWIFMPLALVVWILPLTISGNLGYFLVYLGGFSMLINAVFITRVLFAGEIGGTVSFVGMLGPIVGTTLELLGALGIMKVPLNSMVFGLVIFVVFQSQIVAARFVQAFRQSEHLGRELQREVDRQTRDIRSILDNIKQGIFTLLNPGRVIGPQFSPFTRTMMGQTQLEARTVEEVLLDQSDLSSDQKAQLHAALDSCLGEDAINFEFNSECLPHEIILQRPNSRPQTLEVDWSPILDDQNRVEKILVCARDVTEVRQLRVEAEKSQKELTILQEIIKVPEDRFARFLQKSIEYLNENSFFIKKSPDGSEQITKRMFVNLHTLKGTARTYQFKLLAAQSHDAEQFLAEMIKGKEAWNSKRVMQDLRNLQDTLQNYQEVAENKLHWNLGNQVVKIKREDIIRLLPILQGLNSEIQSHEGRSKLALLGTRMLENCYTSLNDIIAEASRGIDSMARDLGKNSPELTISPNRYLLVDEWADKVHSILTHVFRNSMDHGLESKAERKQAGKHDTGNIFIELSDDSVYLKLSVQDDGRGLDLERIKKIGMERSLIQDESMSDTDIAMLIFHSGFSTKDEVTDISGRGVGMDAVKSYLEEGSGKVQIELESDPINRQHVVFSLHMHLPRRAWVEAPSAEKFDILQQMRVS